VALRVVTEWEGLLTVGETDVSDASWRGGRLEGGDAAKTALVLEDKGNQALRCLAYLLGAGRTGCGVGSLQEPC